MNKLKTRLVALLLVATLCGGHISSLQSYAAENTSDTVLILGDSISAAYGLKVEDGWVALLQQRLDENNYPFEVANASVTGDTTANGLGRLPALLDEYQPSLVIIELGGNDGLRGLSIKKLKENLSSMASMAKDTGAETIIVSVQLPGNYGKAYNTMFSNAFSTAAETTGATLVTSLFDGMDASAEWFQRDGIHPSKKAQIVMLDNVWHVAEPLIEKLSSVE